VNFLQKISAYSIRFIEESELPDLAITGLEEGFDSPSLRMLASHNSADNPFLLKEYFKNSLLELGIREPSPIDATKYIVEFHADRIINGELDPLEGFEEIDYTVMNSSLSYSKLDLDECYAEFLSISEVANDGLQLHTALGLSKEEYIDDGKKQLTEDLRQWKARLGSA
jgi:hypothetical protein